MTAPKLTEAQRRILSAVALGRSPWSVYRAQSSRAATNVVRHLCQKGLLDDLEAPRLTDAGRAALRGES